MDLCGEHGFKEIAYSNDRGANCPACDQVEELTNDFERRIEELESTNEGLSSEIDDLQAQLDAISLG